MNQQQTEPSEAAWDASRKINEAPGPVDEDAKIVQAAIDAEHARRAERLVNYLSEAAVEIENLDGPRNPIAKRVRQAIRDIEHRQHTTGD